jgi:hypothetical protein
VALAAKVGGTDGQKFRDTLERSPPLGIKSWDEELSDDEYERRLATLEAKLPQMLAFLDEVKPSALPPGTWGHPN